MQGRINWWIFYNYSLNSTRYINNLRELVIIYERNNGLNSTRYINNGYQEYKYIEPVIGLKFHTVH